MVRADPASQQGGVQTSRVPLLEITKFGFSGYLANNRRSLVAPFRQGKVDSPLSDTTTCQVEVMAKDPIGTNTGSSGSDLYFGILHLRMG